jgi:hypothetical protein
MEMAIKEVGEDQADDAGQSKGPLILRHCRFSPADIRNGDSQALARP